MTAPRYDGPAVEGLVAKWRNDQVDFPKTVAGDYAAAAVRACANELEAALLSTPARTHEAGGEGVDIAVMVNRFLGWRVPDDFTPDGGVIFKPIEHPDDATVRENCWPTGTNLLSATQAKAMFEYVLAGSMASVPDFVHKALASADEMLDSLGYAHTDLRAARDWLKGKCLDCGYNPGLCDTHDAAPQEAQSPVAWLGMDSAPQDRNVKMLGLLPSGRVCTIQPSWRQEYIRNDDGSCKAGAVVFAGYNEDRGDALIPCRPTRWMPIPSETAAAPVPASGEVGEGKVLAAAKALYITDDCHHAGLCESWDTIPDYARDRYLDKARVALSAALNGGAK